MGPGHPLWGTLKMPYIWNMNILLHEYNLWPQPKTFYEVRHFDAEHRVYLIACHEGHTNCLVKVNYPVFVGANI